MQRLIAAAFALIVFSLFAHAQTFDERVQLCLACHGEKGTSETSDVPSLGGQPSPYVLIQLYMFREKLRVADPMNDMMQGVSDADLQKLADLVAKLPPPAVPADAAIDPARAARVAGLVATHRCAFCHNDFKGSDSVPRIAAQREDYLTKTLAEYKGGKRAEYQPVMAEIVRKLSDQDIADLAHVLSRTSAK